MGGPLSSLVADVFLAHMEGQILSDTVVSQNILFYTRYVDDILCIWKESDDDINFVLSKMNSFHPSMNVVMEIGADQVLNFLDLTLPLSTHNS